jgi:hypothetical protein
MNRFLKRLELRTNRAYWGDGLLDLFCGFALLVLGVCWVMHQAAFGGITPALLIPLWGPLRKRFTEPRLGVVELAEKRQDRNRAFIGLMLVAGALSFLLGIGVFLGHEYDLELSIIVVKAMPGSLVGIAGIATAEALQLRRFFVYGGITLVTALVVGFVPELNPGWAFVSGGLCALIGGALLATKFSRLHPVRTEEKQQ